MPALLPEVLPVIQDTRLLDEWIFGRSRARVHFSYLTGSLGRAYFREEVLLLVRAETAESLADLLTAAWRAWAEPDLTAHG